MTTAPARVTIFRYTGKQGFFTIPASACQECEITVHLAHSLREQFPPGTVKLRLRPWWLCFWKVLWKGGWHPPIVTIDGKLFSQGKVPDRECLKQAIKDVMAHRPFMKTCEHAV
jgi:hypothetical protein